MKSGSKEDEHASAAGRSGNGKPPHWRRREHAATAVYVVHPAQFRTVVQQLTAGTGAASPPPVSSQHQHVGGGGNGGATRSNNAAARAEHGGGEQSRGRTLGQMHQECLAWANADDDA